MGVYLVTAPDGRKFRLTGDVPPTDAELDEIFGNKFGNKGDTPPPPTQIQKPKEPLSFGSAFLNEGANMLPSYAGKGDILSPDSWNAGGIGDWIKSVTTAPVQRAAEQANQAHAAGNYPLEALATLKQAVPGLAPATEYIADKLQKAKDALMNGGTATDVVPGGEMLRNSTDTFLQNIATKGRPEAYGRVSADALAQAALTKAPVAVPAAIQALKANAGTIGGALGAGAGTYAIYSALEGMSPAARAAAEVALAAGGLKYGKGAIVRSIGDLIKGKEVPVAPKPTGLPDISGPPTGEPNVPLTGVMPPEPPPTPAAEVSAPDLQSLVQQALPPKPKFTHEAARDAAIELFNNGVSKKDAPGLLKNMFGDSHPDVINTIIKEEYKRLIDKATGKPVAAESTTPAPSSSEPVPSSPPATEQVPAESPAVNGRRWQQENLQGITDPAERARLIDEQTAKNFSGAKVNQSNSGAGDNARAWIKKYNESDPAGRKAMISGLSGKLNYEDMRQLASYNGDITSDNPAPPPLSFSSAKPQSEVPPAIEALKKQSDIAKGLNEVSITLAKQISEGSIQKTKAIDSLVYAGAKRQYAIYLIEKALKGQ